MTITSEFLTRHRALTGLPQHKIAEICGVAQSTIARYERATPGSGEIDLESLRRLRKYCLAVGLPWQDAWLFEPAAIPQPQQETVPYAS